MSAPWGCSRRSDKLHWSYIGTILRAVHVSTATEAYSAGRATRAIARPQRRTSIVKRLAHLAGRRLPSWHDARTAVLQVAGLGLVDAGAFELNTVAGLVSTGVSLLLLEWLSGDA